MSIRRLGVVLVVLAALSTADAGEPLDPVLARARAEAERWQGDAHLVQMEFGSFGFATGLSGVLDLTRTGPPRFATFQYLSPSSRRALLVTVEINRTRSAGQSSAASGGDKRVWVEPLPAPRGRFTLPIPDRLEYDLDAAIARAERTLGTDCPTATPATCAIVRSAELHVHRRHQDDALGAPIWTIQFGESARTQAPVGRTVDATTGDVGAVTVTAAASGAPAGQVAAAAQVGRRSAELEHALSGVIPPVRATATALRFFEGPSPLPPDPQRSFDDVFFYGDARYIYWELSLVHPAPGRPTSFTLEEIWQGPGISHRTARVFTLQSEWTSSVFFGGARLVATRTMEMASPSYSADECARQRRAYGSAIDPPACAQTIPVDIHTWPPGTYQVDLLVDKQPVARAWFAMSTREQLARGIEGRSADRAAPTRTIGVVPATVSALRFFEAGATASPRGERRYATAFRLGATRNIVWELDLKHAAPGRWVPVVFEALLYQLEGDRDRLVQRRILQTAVPPDWSDTFHSDQFGWPADYYWDRAGGSGPSPRAWRPGAYRVDLYMADTKVASGTFEVR